MTDSTPPAASHRSRLIGGALVLLGLGGTAAVLLADALGLGDAPGIGWQQRLVASGGVLLALAGAALTARSRLPGAARTREVVGRLALAVGSLLFGLLMAEIGLRIVRPPSVAFDHQPTIYQPDPTLGFRYVPNSRDRVERLEYRQPVRVNNAGFVDDDFSLRADPEGTRIAAIGDSFTAGLQVGRGRTYPDVLERELNEAGLESCPCEVMNFGMDGTGTVQQAAILEDMALDYQPDVVIVAYFSLDVVDVAYPTVQRDVYRDYIIYYRDDAERSRVTRQVDDLLDGGGKALRAVLRYSYISRALYNSWLDRHGNPEPNLRSNKNKPEDITGVMTLAQAESAVVESAAAMQRVCDEAGCELVFVVIPTKEEVAGDTELGYLPVLQGVEEQGIRAFSLLEPFREHTARGEELYWRYDSHTNRAGYRLMAEEILAFLRREGLI